MGLSYKAHQKHAVPRPHQKALHGAGARSRLCRFEQMEPRQLLSVAPAPIHVGATYFEDSNEIDQSSVLQGTGTQVADLFQISFTGGAAGTELTKVAIDTRDKSFFDTASGGPGVYGSFQLKIVSHDGFEVIGPATVVDGSTKLEFTFRGFQAGEKLVFSIDVDETGATAVCEGAEFDGEDYPQIDVHLLGATCTASFTAPHMEDLSSPAILFNDVYDFVGTGLENSLPNDNYNNTAANAYVPENCSAGPVYTAGANGQVQQVPLPSTLSGTVFKDLNADNQRQTGEPGIAGVQLTLLELVGSNYVDTGKTATTDADGYYHFDNLLPSTYRVVETQPNGYASVGATPGTVNGATHGVATTVNILSSINLDGGEDSVHNDFAETKFSISGYVYVDADNDGVFDPGESPIGGAQLTLLDADYNSVGMTTTDATGFYRFEGLAPGTYGVAETQPMFSATREYDDGLDRAGALNGTVDGTAYNPGDLIDSIILPHQVSPIDSPTNNRAIQYNFGELPPPPASISGLVYADLNDDWVIDAGEPLLRDVPIYLLDASGNPIASTMTDALGQYQFTNLPPGVYSVEEGLTPGYLEGGNRVGSVDGVAEGVSDGVNLLSDVPLDWGQNGIRYDFREVVPAKISGYVFQDGPTIVIKEGDPQPNIPALRDGKLTPDDTRLSGVVLQLCDGSGWPLEDADGNPITAVTDANGYYEFNMLFSGVYTIVEIQPSQYQPGIDTVGSKGGLVVNSYVTLDPMILSTLTLDPSGAAIARIVIDPGDVAVEYNFSEVLVRSDPPDTPPKPPPYIPPPSPPTPPMPAPVALPFVEYRPVGQAYYLTPQIVMRPMSGGSGGPGGYSWHLSVIDAGQPRQDGSGDQFTQYPQNSIFDPVSWTGADLGQSQWILADKDGVPIETVRFGMSGAIPVTGDWDGSGTTKVGVFLDGLWFLDLDGDSLWDEGDLWAKLGKKSDQPASGDWNGDGKTDIGIFGLAWIGDLKAVSVEPGLPDAMNPPKGRPKNVPPDAADAAVGWRTMKKGHVGKMRSDVIDHVFQYGTKGDRAVTGDWNGDGIYTVGIFRNGTWFLDMDGDGRWSEGDVMVHYGQEGDLPVVGDWTGDGISKLGVYRNGTFYLDTNNNHQLDATDKVFQLGHAGDKPVSGDWQGDGVDEVGVYEGAAAAEPQTASGGGSGTAAAVK